MTITDKDEMGLLLYLETRAVDHAGAVDTIHMNSVDHVILDRWTTSGFVQSGRIASKDGVMPKCSIWCTLSAEAWMEAHRLRQERADRMWKKKPYLTTQEKRDA